MKIVYCIAATHNAGGMERVLANKVNYLVARGHELYIITTDQQEKHSFFFLDKRVRLYDLGINYCDNQDNAVLRKVWQYKRKQHKHKKALTELLISIGPDITISMFDHEVSFLWRIPDSSKKIVEIHFSRFKRLQYGRSGLLGILDKWRSHQDKIWAEKYAQFVVLTEEDKTYWGNMENIAVIPNANSFLPDVQATLTNNRVIAVGRYDYQKGFDELIQAWALIDKTFSDWSLHIFGKGPLKGALLDLIAKLGLKRSVFLEDPVIDIRHQYINSSVLAMTSRYEGLPMALLEAQVCGLPMVAYACKCGPRDIIQEGKNGFLIEEGDRISMANRLQQLMLDSELRIRMGSESTRLSANFSEDMVMNKWLDLFHQLHSPPSLDLDKN
ncbi:glycosyltransferase family 4 protein [Sphingobacterium oryzagri]|uniref:Glycosyltransferase family 4 protein n=1 Tax=Sphingobacterium oryzagri TaxID=3025669 RepID=A0ABY7WGP3_9SPHI|nr:glycosyltransferase family 4 protein [Sphingobacterium sp. KACC 22765]WDF68348.1 glycosyltransferase family 4 protein [Sphingobacterium sp. KACC 22765]